MAITGIDTIDGKQIIAAGAVSAKSAEMAYKDENGNPITGYQVAGDYYSASNPSGFITGVDLTPYQTTAGMTAYQPVGDYYSASNPSGFITGVDLEPYQLTADMTAYQPIGDYLTTADSANFYTTANESGFITGVPDTYLQNTDLTITDGKISEISGVPLSAGSTPTYDYTDNNLISSIDTSGLYATSALEAKSAVSANRALWIPAGRRLDAAVEWNTIDSQGYGSQMVLNPLATPFTVKTGIYSPLSYATGAVITYGSSGNGSAQYFGGFLKGNEWYVSNATAGQALRGETHASRGVHISGATTAGNGFNLGIRGVWGTYSTANNYNWTLGGSCVSGKDSNGEWYYGSAEDAALRAVSSCDMHESAFEYDASDNITGYNGSAFAGGSDVPEGVMVESGLEYNAVNEISGYNGSAIAQYGAEKQWLQHDDTLLHVANSAQYALGVNLSAVAQLLGVDETVLWESNTTAGQIITAGIDLSETMNNFKEVKFVYRNGINYAPVDYISPHSALVNFNFVHAGGGTNAWMQWSQFSAVNSGTKIYMMKCKALNYGNATATGNVTVTATTANDLFYLYQVVGIGRKGV